MRKFDELHLVNMAWNMIGKTDLNRHRCGLLLDDRGKVRPPREWYSMLNMGPLRILRTELAKMQPGTMACILSLAVSKQERGVWYKYRTTNLDDLLHGESTGFPVLDFGTLPLAITGTEGERILKYFVELVLVGAMYDIIVAKLRLFADLASDSGDSPLPEYAKSLQPKPDMLVFAGKHRLAQKRD